MSAKNPLVEYIEANSKLMVSQRISKILPLGVFIFGQLAVVLSAIYNRELLESIPVCLGILFCPGALGLPVAVAFLVGETYNAYAPKVGKVRELKRPNLSDRQLVQGLLRGTFAQMRPLPELTAALATVMATSLAFQVDFWDTWPGSYAPPPPPLSSYTTVDYIQNAVFWYGFYTCLVALNLMAAFLSIWVCIRWRGSDGSSIASFLISGIIVGLGLLFLSIMFSYGYWIAWVGACVLPILTFTLLAYGAAHASLRRNRFC